MSSRDNAVAPSGQGREWGAGVPHVQAEAFAEALRQAQGESEVVTKKDLQVELAPVRTDLILLKWMMGLLLAGVMSLILKAFF